MRLAIPFLFLATPALGWEFSALPICTLTGPNTVVTYDANIPEYSITVTNPAGDWPAAPDFAMRFDGPNPLAIGTDRHVIDGDALTVRDSGFGNVLNGLQLNDTALAVSGGVTVEIPLAGAATAIAAFRDCPAEVLS